MNKIIDSDWILPVLVFASSFAVAGAVWYGASVMEAKTYNKLTGANVSGFDAMWVQLRVIEPAKAVTQDD